MITFEDATRGETDVELVREQYFMSIPDKKSQKAVSQRELRIAESFVSRQPTAKPVYCLTPGLVFLSFGERWRTNRVWNAGYLNIFYGTVYYANWYVGMHADYAARYYVNIDGGMQALQIFDVPAVAWE